MGPEVLGLRRERTNVRQPVAWLLIPLLATALAACTANDVAQTPGAHAVAADAAICLQGGPFVADGAVRVEASGPGDAAEVAGLRWESHPGCERFVVDLVTADGSPAASVGEVRAEVIRDLGVVRLSLRDVERVAPDATDATMDGPLARAAYVMWSGAGRWIDVDVHLAAEAEANVSVLDDPARVAVDLRPGGGPLPPAPARDVRVVVLEPRPGEAAYPLTVTGYARTFEANVVARIERGGEEVTETFTTATAWVDAWGHFSLTFQRGPSGPIVLHVGEYSARDGTWEGVAMELVMK